MPDSAPPPLRIWLPLLQDTLRREGSFRWMLRGDSMSPTLRPGTEILISPRPLRLRTGMIAVFAAGEALVAHRLVRATPRGWLAQGDHQPWPDRPLVTDDILGVVVAASAGDQSYWPAWWSPLADRCWVARAYLLAAKRRMWRQRQRSLWGRAGER